MLAATPIALASEPEEDSHEAEGDVNLSQSSITAKNLTRVVGGEHPSVYDRFTLTGTTGVTTKADQFTLYLTLGASAGGVTGEDHHLKVPQDPGRYVGPVTAVEFHFQGPLGSKQETSYFRFGTHWSSEFWNISEDSAAERQTAKIYLTGTPGTSITKNVALGPRLYGAVEVDEWRTDANTLGLDGSLALFVGNRKSNGWMGVRYTTTLDHEPFEGYHPEGKNLGVTGTLNLTLPKHVELYIHADALWGIPSGHGHEDKYVLQIAVGDHKFDVGLEGEVERIVEDGHARLVGVVGVDLQVKFDGPTYRR